MPVSVVVPVPALVSVPVPLMAPATVRALLREITSAPLFITGPDPSAPVVPPFPSCSVPALIVVPPLYVLVPVSVVVPVPACVTVPVPLITPA